MHQHQKIAYKTVSMEGQQKTKQNIQVDIMILLGKDCEVKKMMRFLMDIGMFEKI